MVWEHVTRKIVARGIHPQFDVAIFNQGAERVQSCALLGCGNAPGQLPGQVGYAVLSDAHSSGAGYSSVSVFSFTGFSCDELVEL